MKSKELSCEQLESLIENKIKALRASESQIDSKHTAAINLSEGILKDVKAKTESIVSPDNSVKLMLEIAWQGIKNL